MTLAINQIHQVDCVQALKQIKDQQVDLAFADPPFNIGYDYDVYDDRLEREHYLDWSREWISGVYRALKPSGTFWLAIGDEYAAELKLISQEVGFTCRSWVIWYYTFGVNCTRKFNRSHAHLFHFVKDAKSFTFNDAEIRVPSARQLVYADTRANPAGRLPDDTWILRPQDLVDGFTPEEETWYFPRVAGTFKERAGFHGCQMPEQLLGRIIRCCSNPGDLVLDPFSGSATTLVVSKKLGRRFLGFELSEDYATRGQSRLDKIEVGDPLEGAADPLRSAPATMAGKTVGRGNSATRQPKAEVAQTSNANILADVENVIRGIIDAYGESFDGFSVDRVVADPELNARFLERCAHKGLPGTGRELNRMLFRLRKAGKLSHLPAEKRTEFGWEHYDRFMFASEIAMSKLTNETHESLDDLLCDPERSSELDRIASTYAPGFKPLEYRWAALKIRKAADDIRSRASQLRKKIELGAKFDLDDLKMNRLDAVPGLYLIQDGPKLLYLGETFNLRDRLQQQFQTIAQRAVWLDGARKIQIKTAALKAKSKSKFQGSVALDLMARQSNLIQSWKSVPKFNYSRLASA